MHKRVVDDQRSLVGFQPVSISFRLFEPYLVDHFAAKVDKSTRRACFMGVVTSGLEVTTGTLEGADAPNLDNKLPVTKATFQFYETTENDVRGIGKIHYFEKEVFADNEEPGPLVELSLNVPPGTIDLLKSTDILTHVNVVEAYLDEKTSDVFVDRADRLIWDVTKNKNATVIKAECLSKLMGPMVFRDPDGYARSIVPSDLEAKVSSIEKLVKLILGFGVLALLAEFARSCR